MSFEKRRQIQLLEQFPRNEEIIKDSLYHLMMISSLEGGSHWSDGIKLLKYTLVPKKEIIFWIECHHSPLDTEYIQNILNFLLKDKIDIICRCNDYYFPSEDDFIPNLYKPSLPHHEVIGSTISSKILERFQFLHWKEENPSKIIEEVKILEIEYPFFINETISLLKGISLFKLGLKEELLKLINLTSKDLNLPEDSIHFKLLIPNSSIPKQQIDPSRSIIQSIDKDNPNHFFFFLKGLLESLIISSSPTSQTQTQTSTLLSTDFKILLNRTINNPFIPSFIVIGHMYSAIGDHDSSILLYNRALKAISISRKIPFFEELFDSIRISISSQFLLIGNSTLALCNLETCIDQSSSRYLNEFGVYLFQKGLFNDSLHCFKRAIDNCGSKDLLASFLHNYYVCRLKMITSYTLSSYDDLSFLIREGFDMVKDVNGGGGIWGDNIKSFIIELSLLVLDSPQVIGDYSLELEEAIKLITSSNDRSNTALDRRKRNALQRLLKMKRH